MRLFLDLDTRSFIESAQFQRAVSSLVLKRRDHLPVDVQFLRGGVVVGLADGATGKLGLKADKDFNGSFAASDLEWAKSGTGDATTYRFDLNLNTVQINALFAGVPTPASVSLMLEIEWAEGELRTSSNTLAVTLENDIVRGDEGVVEEGGPVYPLPGAIELIARKGQNSGYAGLDDSGKVPVAQLPQTGPVLRETQNRFVANHSGWKVGDIIRQLGDTSTASLVIEVTSAVPGGSQEEVEITALAVPEGETSGFQLSSSFGSSDEVSTPGPLTAGEHAMAIYFALESFGACSSPHGDNADKLTFTFNSPGAAGASLAGVFASLEVITTGVDQLAYSFSGGFYDQNWNNYSASVEVYGPMSAEDFAQEIANALTNNISLLNVTVSGAVVSASYTFPGQLISQPYFYDPTGNGQLWQTAFTDGVDGVPPGTFLVSDISALSNAGGYKGIGDTVDFLSGYGAPTRGVGSTGNGYVDLNNGDFYHCSESGWVFVLNIKGPPGQTGAVGASGTPGTAGAPGFGAITSTQANKMLATWTSRTSPSIARDIVWSPELSLFVAISESSVITSSDGITWTSRTPSITNGSISCIEWSPELGLFAACGNSGTSRIMTSPDGINWTNRAAPSVCNDIVWAAELSRFVAISTTEFSGMYSSDGINWTSTIQPVSLQTGVAWSPELGVFVTSGYWRSPMKSFDGITWVTGNSPSLASYMCVTWCPQRGMFVAAARDENKLVYSYDGLTWQERSGFGGCKKLAWISDLGVFVGVASIGNNRIATTKDILTNWYQRMTGSQFYWEGLAWSQDLGILAVVGAGGATSMVATSAFPNRWDGSGVYTPVLTNTANVAASTSARCQWSRKGRVVTVSGQLTIDPTTTLVATELGISLPIPCTFSNSSELGGTACAIVVNEQAGIVADTVNGRASLKYLPTDIAARVFAFHFSYSIR